MRILLVGAGGYAVNYVKILLENADENIIWEGIVDPYFSNCIFKKEIEEKGIPVYDTMEEFFNEHDADFTVIGTPTFLHCEQSIYALSKGSDVLCEKPLAPTMEEAEKMAEAEKKYGHFIAIGYQWSYADAILNLKRDILDGKFGKPLNLKTAISWPRNKAYYKRGGGWGGKIKKDGKLLLDSIASNACAHYLHNMLFILGDTMETSAEFSDFEAECYRANDIENFDTCSFRIKTAGGAELFYIASHASGKLRNPEFEYNFEKGKVTFAVDNGCEIIAEFSDGSTKNYGNPFENEFKKFFDCIKASEEKTVPVCTVKTATPHTEFIYKLYEKNTVKTFDKNLILLNEKTDTVYVKDLFEKMYKAYEEQKMLSEIKK
ncbi:MAG: Gfo/Idh/MocA family oxidoreductase [Clostridia bacterium]|nr:Gfo/Idh/MocA family oxidoreductase [Clostridia bacterium]